MPWVTRVWHSKANGQCVHLEGILGSILVVAETGKQCPSQECCSGLFLGCFLLTSTF